MEIKDKTKSVELGKIILKPRELKFNCILLVKFRTFGPPQLVTYNANPSTAMNRTELSQKFPYIFYLLGLTTFNPFSRQVSNHCNKISVLILTVVIVLATTATFIAQCIEHSLQSLVIINVAAVSFVVTELITCLAIIYKAFAPRQLFERLWHQLRAIEKLYAFKFNENMDFKRFHRNYLCEFCAMVCINLVHIIVNIAFNYGIYDIIVKFMTLVLFTVALMTVFHMLFYVRLLLHFMQLFNERFATTNPNDFNGSAIFRLGAWQTTMLIANFKYIKQVHFLLWDISVLINQQFGWIVVLLFLQNSFDSVHTVYWIVWYLDRNEDWAKTKLLSKY